MTEHAMWEYNCITLGTFWKPPTDDQVEAALDEYGAEGWETVNAFHEQSTNRVRVIFKRPLSDEDAQRRRRRQAPG